MADYEGAAFESVERLKERHMQELTSLSQKIYNETNAKAHKSRELLDLRHQEKIFFAVKDYEKAENCRVHADSMEIYER